MRESIRCLSCELMQFEAALCRRCKKPLAKARVREVPVIVRIPVDSQYFGPTTRVRTLREVEEIAIVDALKKSQSVVEAAKRLGIGKTTLYHKMHRYGIFGADVATYTVPAQPRPVSTPEQAYFFEG